MLYQNIKKLIGHSTSMAIVTIVFSIYNLQLGREYSAMLLISGRTVFIVFTVLCAAGIFASLARGKVRESAAYDK